VASDESSGQQKTGPAKVESNRMLKRLVRRTRRMGFKRSLTANLTIATESLAGSQTA
jgi:hypothetical protein